MPTAGDFDRDELKAAKSKMKVHVPRSAPPIPSSEYHKLSEVERFALKQLRQERDSKETNATAKLHSTVASLKSQVAKLSTARGGGGDSSDYESEDLFHDSDDDKEPPKKKSRPKDNRGHPGLGGPGRQGRSPHRR